MKLSLLVASLLLAVSPVFADSVNTITIWDVNPPYSYNSVPLTPSTLVQESAPGPQPGEQGAIELEWSAPASWTRGEVYTFSLSFDGQTFSGSGQEYMNYGGAIFLLPLTTQDYPATITVSYAGGGAATQAFILEPVPEPGTWALMATGLLGLAAQARWAKQKEEKANS
jgi:hypothetical protein